MHMEILEPIMEVEFDDYFVIDTFHDSYYNRYDDIDHLDSILLMISVII